MCNTLSAWPITEQDQGDKQELSLVKQKLKNKVVLLLYPAGPFLLGCYGMRPSPPPPLSTPQFDAHTYVRKESYALLLFPSAVFLIDLTT